MHTHTPCGLHITPARSHTTLYGGAAALADTTTETMTPNSPRAFYFECFACGRPRALGASLSAPAFDL